MAKATKEVKQVQVTKVEEQEIITLELSKEEAEFLKFLVCSVAGSPTKSLRKHADSIDNALTAVLVSYRDHFNGLVKYESDGIWFMEE